MDNKPPSAETIKEQNEMMLASVSAATKGSVLSATAVVDGMGESTIKTANPVLVRWIFCCRSHLCKAPPACDNGFPEGLILHSFRGRHSLLVVGGNVNSPSEA